MTFSTGLDRMGPAFLQRDFDFFQTQFEVPMPNCYPGNMARVIRGAMIDKLLICTVPVHLKGETYWRFEPLSYGLPDPKNRCIKDSALRPFGDPKLSRGIVTLTVLTFKQPGETA